MPNLPVPIELDRPRHLFFDFNALVVVSENVDIPIYDLLSNYKELMGKHTFKIMRALLLGGLSHEDKTLTLQGAGKLLDPYLKNTREFLKIGQTLQMAFFAAFADETGEAEKKEKGQVPTAMIPKSRGRGKNT